MILAVHPRMTARVDREAEPGAAHQPRPLQIDACLLDADLERRGWICAWVIPDGPARGDTDRFAARCGIRLISAMTTLSDWAAAATTIVAHDLDEVDHAVRVMRVACGAKKPEWLRPRQMRFDTAVAASRALKTEQMPTVPDATEVIIGERLEGLRGVLALHRSESAQATEAAS